MTTLTIETDDKKAKDLIVLVARQLGAKVKTTNTATNKHCKLDHTPNAETIEAMEELKAGKGKVFNSAKELFATVK
jgi:hypothetical protein